MSKKIKKREKIGEALVRMGFMSRDQVESVLHAQLSRQDHLFGAIAVDLGYVDEETIEKYVDMQKVADKV